MKILNSFRADIIIPAVLPIIIGAIIDPRPPLPPKPINHGGSMSKHSSFKTSSVGSAHSTFYSPKSSNANGLSKLFENISF